MSHEGIGPRPMAIFLLVSGDVAIGGRLVCGGGLGPEVEVLMQPAVLWWLRSSS